MASMDFKINSFYTTEFPTLLPKLIDNPPTAQGEVMCGMQSINKKSTQRIKENQIIWGENIMVASPSAAAIKSCCRFVVYLL